MTASATSHPGSPSTASRTKGRSALRIGTALAGMLAATAASASTMPTGGAFAVGAGTLTPGGGGTFTGVTTAAGGVVTWTTFDVPTGNTFTFSGCVSCTVLNRVTTAAASTIDGTITANGVNVWLVNGAGITFSSTGKFNGGSLVLSTLQDNVTTLAQLNGTAASEFTTANGLLAMNGTITSTGSVLLVGKTVSVGAGAGDRIAATGGSTPASNPVVMIAASDVAFPSGPGSPLSYLIKSGTAVAANQLTVSGAIKGSSVVIGAMSPSVANTALLQIASTGSLTATVDGGKVTISTDNNASATHDGTGQARSAFDQINFAGGTAAQTTGTNGSIDVFGPAVLTGNTTLISSGTGATTFAGTIDGGKTLTVTGDAEFDGVVGGATALTSTDVSGKTKIATTAITTTGAQTYTGAVTLTANTTLTSTGNGAVGLGGVTGSGKTLTVAAGTGAVNVTGQVGTTAQPLGAVSLTGGAISLAGVDSSALTLTNSGVLTLGAGNYTIGAVPYTFGAATTNGTLTLGQDTSFGALTLASATTLDGSTGNKKITLAAVDAAVDGASGLTVKTGTALATLGGAVGGTNKLALLDVTGPSAINTTTIKTTGNQTYTGAVTLGANATLSSTANGTITVGAVAGAGKSLDVQTGSTGAIALNGVTGTTALTLANTSLTLNTGTYTINAGSPFTFGAATTNGTLTLGQITAFGALTLGSDTTINSSAGNFNQILGAVTGASHALVVNAGTGAIALNGVNGTSALTLTRNLLTLNTGTYDVDGGAAFNFGAATTNGTLTLKQKTTFGAITLGSDTTIADPSGFGTIYSSIDGAHAFAVNAFGAALIVIGGHVGTVGTPLTSLKLTGTTQLNGGSVFTQGVQTYTGQFNVGANTTLDSSAGNGDIGFSSVLLASIATPLLTVKAGTGAISAGGQIGTIANPYGAVSLTGGKITLAGVDAGSLTLTNSNTLTLNAGNYTIGAAPYTFGAATTNGTLTLGQATTFGALTLGSATTLDGAVGNRAVTLDTVDGAFGLTVKTGTATATFGNAVGGSAKLASLSVTGPSLINTTEITTSGAQTYTGAVTLGATTTLDSSAGDGPIDLGAVTGAAFGLTVNAGTGTLALHGVTGTTALALTDGGLTLNTGTYTPAGGSAYTFGPATTNGTLTLGQATTFGTLTLGSDTTITSAAGNFAQTLGAVTGASHALVLNAGTGALTLNGVNGTSALGLTDGALTLNGGTYNVDGGAAYTFGAATTNGTLTLGQATTFGAMTLGSATTLDGSSGNRAVTLGTVDGLFGLTVKTGTATATFGGLVGNLAKLTSLSVTGPSQINTTAITTSGTQTYSGAVTLGATTTLDSSAGNAAIALGAVTGAGNGLTVNAGTGAVTLNGVTGTTALALTDGALTLNGGTYTPTGGAAYTFGAATTNGTLTLGQATTFGALTLGSGTTLDSSAGNFAQTLGAVTGAGNGLTVNAGTGALTLNGVTGTSALTLTNGALTLNGGTYTPTGGTAYTFGAATTNGTLTLGQATTFGALTLGSATTLNSAAGNFAQTLGTVTGGGNALTVTTGTGALTLNGVAGTASLTLTNGPLTLNAGTYDVDSGAGYTFGAATTNGTLVLGQATTFGPLTLGSATTLDGTVGNRAVTLGTVDGAADLTVKTGTATATFGGAVGGTTRLTALTVAGPAAINTASIKTSGAQDYKGAVTLGSATTLDSTTGNGAISFEQALDGAFDLTVTAGTGQTTFGGVVGGGTRLSSLTVTGTSLVKTSGINTTGAQNYQGAVTLGATTALDSSAGNGTVTLSPVTGAGFGLTVKAGTGAITLNGVTGTSALILADGLLTLNAGTYTPAGGAAYTFGAATTNGTLALGQATTFGPLTLGSATTLNSSAGNFAQTLGAVTGGGFGLTVNAGSGAVTLNGVNGTSSLVLTDGALTLDTGIYNVDGGAPYTFGAATTNGTLTLGQATTFGALTLGSATTLDSSAGNFAAVLGAVTGAGNALTVKAGTGAITLNGVTGTSALTLANGLLTLNAGTYTPAGGAAYTFGAATTNGTLTLGQATTFGAMTLGSDTTLNSSAGNFAQTLGAVTGAGNALTVNAGTGAVTLNGVNGTSSLVLTDGALTLDTGIYNVDGGAAYTFGAATTNGTLTLGQATTFGAATLGSATTLDSSAGNFATVLGAVTGAGNALSVNAGTGAITLNGVTGTSALTLANGLLTLNAGTYDVDGGAAYTFGAATTNGTLTLGQATTFGAMTLGSDTTLDGAVGNRAVTLGTVDGANALVVKTGTSLATFNGVVGGATKLASLTVNGPASIGTAAISTTGAQDYQGAVMLGVTTTLDSSAGNSAISFAQTLDGPGGLTAKAGTGLTTFGGGVGATTRLAALTVTGASAINGGGVVTTGAQSYQGAVTLGAATTLDSSTGNGTIGFDSTIDGAFALTAKAGTGLTTFGGAVGSGTKLASLTVTGSSAINTAAITTTGAQDYQGAVTLGVTATLDSSAGNGAISFDQALDGGFGLTTKAGTGLTTFGGAVGAGTKLSALTVTGTSAINGGSVATTGAQDYQGAVTLGATTTINSSAGNGAVTFAQTLDGAHVLTVNAGTGLTTFGGAVGGLTKLTTLTVTGASAINGGSVATTGAQSYQGPVTLGAATTLDSSAGNGDIGFGSTIDGGFALTAKAGTGLTTFGGTVGGGTKLAALTVTGASKINTAGISTTGAQNYQGATTLVTAATLTGSTMTFGSTLDGAFGLTVQGNGVFGGVVGGTSALGALTVTGTGQINTTGVTTTGAQNWQGAVTLGSASTLTTGNDATFGSTIDGAQALTIKAAAGKANFNGVVGGATPLTSLSVTATGAGINAAINAGAISLIDSGAAGSSLWLGDLSPFGAAGTPAASDFVLSKAAIANLQATGALTLDASQVNKPNVITGNFTIAGSVKTMDIYGLNSMFVWGKIDAIGTGLTGLEIGGDGTAASVAKQLTVIATPGTLVGGVPTINGGAIATPSAALSLKADAIAVGQDLGFLSLLGMKPGGTISSVQAQGMINNPASSLYSSIVGGGARYVATDIIVAKSMAVRFTNFALFQNTAVQGQNSGITLSTSLLPSTPALTVFGGGTTNTDPFAVFGTINGVGGIPTALLGGAVITATNISVPVSRINGCVIGSSAGCITAAALSTTLQAVDPSRVTLFYANTDYVVAFDPLVGTNNEALFDDFGSLGVGDVREPAPACKPDDKTCPEHQKGAH
ncbi:filamentous hemagglutinin N-terminal domain-containing protein [Novosphingobium sp.]|uniref:filamentous hemagglutinin N-terminal domain-containing protein n=1 Tax=Novosphingobium sp. TaxID=1874826 RepID=UPI00333F9640